MQCEAVLHTEGPLLIIAGAGSGKTTVLCRRIANLILACNVRPYRILAVTFTNKAANELKERLAAMGADADDVWACTFHSCCVKMLRRGIERLGYKPGFTIFDADDSARVIKQCMADLGITDKAFNPKVIQSIISRAKDQMISAREFDGDENDYILSVTKQVYVEYQKRLKQQNALDFDDIIFNCVVMLRENADILEKWQRQFSYIMVDEYQDTNIAQFELVLLLSGGSANLCVVGDEDQSIYRFRGATIENILSFERQFSARVIKLEQNYRSTDTILKAANAVISKNSRRNVKNLWTDLGTGDKIKLVTLSDEREEASFVASSIAESENKKYSDNAILYRTNAQSRNFEFSLSRMGIPYIIIGGTRFYERKEVKDIIAYLSVLDNPFDMLRLRRIINVPKRNIGEATQTEIERLALEHNASPIEIIENADKFETLYRKAKPLSGFLKFFREILQRAQNPETTPDELIEDILELSGYRLMLMSEGEEGMGRLQNIEELKSAAITFVEDSGPENSSLSEFLGHCSLMSATDISSENNNRVVLMTIHAAKGTEFNNVYLVGAEENIFPSMRSLSEHLGEEEERRLAYVAITRARKKLCITHAKQRLFFGQTNRNRLSRFIADIPPDCIEPIDKTVTANTQTTSYFKRTNTTGGYLQNQNARPTMTAKTDFVREPPAHGARVKHKAFGKGTVIGITPKGNDTLAEVAFDILGTKKVSVKFLVVENP